ncbi:MAG: preprotein translocase subunit SecG [Oscillospiraceae bacterium]
MNILEIISGVLLIVCSVVIILLVLAQEAKQGGMGALTGGGEAYSDMQSRSTDAKIAKVTKYAAIAFFVLTIAVSAISIFAK